MKILPKSTKPPGRRVRRRHNPEARTGRRGYRSYRDCLRWEFGFSCGFCLLHEADLAAHGAEGLGIMGVEHFVPVTAATEAINDYANCFYACRLCNGARSNVAVSLPEKRLLNPCDDVWGEHFEADGDRLLPRRGDRDAEHTEKIYDLNDPRKRRARRLRREMVSECWDLIDEGSRRAETLIMLSEKYDDVEILTAAQDLRRCVRLAVKEIEAFAAVPFDSPEHCRCDLRNELALPKWLDEQTLEV